LFSSFIFNLADKYYTGTLCERTGLQEDDFLRDVITPLYELLQDQSWKVIGGKLVKKEKDNSQTIGYDVSAMNHQTISQFCSNKIPHEVLFSASGYERVVLVCAQY